MTAPNFEPARSGVYRAPADVEALRRSAPAGLKWVAVDPGPQADKPRLMRSFAVAFGFPPNFGENWDALADALQDLATAGVAGYVIHLKNAPEHDWPALFEVLRATAAWWRDRAKTFIVFVERDGALPEWT